MTFPIISYRLNSRSSMVPVPTTRTLNTSTLSSCCVKGIENSSKIPGVNTSTSIPGILSWYFSCSREPIATTLYGHVLKPETTKRNERNRKQANLSDIQANRSAILANRSVPFRAIPRFLCATQGPNSAWSLARDFKAILLK